jgi:hypothetical protein
VNYSFSHHTIYLSRIDTFRFCTIFGALDCIRFQHLKPNLRVVGCILLVPGYFYDMPSLEIHRNEKVEVHSLSTMPTKLAVRGVPSSAGAHNPGQELAPQRSANSVILTLAAHLRVGPDSVWATWPRMKYSRTKH